MYLDEYLGLMLKKVHKKTLTVLPSGSL